MNVIVEKILEDAKIAYKESVMIDNDTLEAHLLSIIGNAQSILNKTITPKKKIDSKENKDTLHVEHKLHVNKTKIAFKNKSQQTQKK